MTNTIAMRLPSLLLRCCSGFLNYSEAQDYFRNIQKQMKTTMKTEVLQPVAWYLLLIQTKIKTIEFTKSKKLDPNTLTRSATLFSFCDIEAEQTLCKDFFFKKNHKLQWG